MSIDFKKIISDLQGDYRKIGLFLENPSAFLSQYNLNADEYNALISRDFESLTTLGAEKELAAGVMSSPWAHSQRCTER